MLEKAKAFQEKNPKIPDVNVDFINNEQINAVAAKKDGKYFIGIYWGTVFLIWDLFLRMMTSPKVYSQVGDVSKETVNKIYNPQQTVLSTLILASTRDRKRGPIDSKRNLYATLLTRTALDFLFFHEYGHIINGHVDLLGNLKNDFSLNEAVKIGDSANSLLHQTLEMDADCFAINSNIRFLQNLNQDNPNNQFPQEGRNFFIGLENGIENFLFSFYALFRIFGYKSYLPEKIASYDHPPEGIKQRIIFSTLATMFLDHKELKKILELTNKTINNVENAFDEISESSMNTTAITDAYSPFYSKHLRSIMKNWNKVRTQLEPYAYHKLAPLDESW